jgi:hypothetical protein
MPKNRKRARVSRISARRTLARHAVEHASDCRQGPSGRLEISVDICGPGTAPQLRSNRLLGQEIVFDQVVTLENRAK